MARSKLVFKMIFTVKIYKKKKILAQEVWYKRNSGCSELVFTVWKKLLATKSMQKPMSKSVMVEKNMSFSVITVVWLREHRAFVVDCFIKAESYVAVQRAFYKKFKLQRHDSVLSDIAISTWQKTFRETSVATSVGAVGQMRSEQTAENNEKL